MNKSVFLSERNSYWNIKSDKTKLTRKYKY